MQLYPNKTILTVATTKLGTAIPIVTMIIIILSTAVFFLSALIVPRTVPIIMAMALENNPALVNRETFWQLFH